MALAISPAAAPPMPSATMNSDPFGAERRACRTSGCSVALSGGEVGDDERVLVVLARAADVGAAEDVDDDLGACESGLDGELIDEEGLVTDTYESVASLRRGR